MPPTASPTGRLSITGRMRQCAYHVKSRIRKSSIVGSRSAISLPPRPQESVELSVAKRIPGFRARASNQGSCRSRSVLCPIGDSLACGTARTVHVHLLQRDLAGMDPAVQRRITDTEFLCRIDNAEQVACLVVFAWPVDWNALAAAQAAHQLGRERQPPCRAPPLTIETAGCRTIRIMPDNAAPVRRCSGHSAAVVAASEQSSATGSHRSVRHASGRWHASAFADCRPVVQRPQRDSPEDAYGRH